MKKMLFCILHGGLLCGFVLIWLCYGLFTEEDKLELKWTELIRQELLHIDPKPRHAFVFVDVSGAKSLIDNEKASGMTVITDRVKLARLINELNDAGTYRYILCDVFFSGESRRNDTLQKDDSLLRDAISRTSRMVVAAQMDKKDGLQRPLIGGNFGIVTYAAEKGTFIKYPMLFRDSLFSLPLTMFRDLYGPGIKKKWFLHINNEMVLNDQTITFRIRPFDWEQDHNFSFYTLEALLRLPKGSDPFKEWFRDKIVVIGDFVNDQHETVIGEMPGPLIPVNAYLALWYKDNRITLPWVLYLVAAFSVLSWVSFFGRAGMEKRVDIWAGRYKALRFISRLFGYGFVLYVIAIGSYLLFHVFINVLVLTVYFSLFDRQLVKKILYKVNFSI